MSVAKEFDIIVYGATGFTGRLVAEYLNNQYGVNGDVKWAMAGRSEDKIRTVCGLIGAPDDTPFVVADANNLASLRDMVNRTKVILTTVGPYQLYGTDLVEACVECGTDYVDLCGEPAWMHEMIKTYGDKAKETGARIVFSCGFDSIPFDLGVFHLQEAAKERFGHTVSKVKGRVRKMKGTFSGGTAASLKATMAAAMQNPGVLEVLKNPFSLTLGFTGVEQPSGAEVIYEDDMKSWAAPFIMAAINTRNIHRSNMLLGHAYGQDFVYDEMMLTGDGDEGQAIAKAVGADKSLASDDAPKPGEGPSKEERETGFYDVLFIGIDGNGDRIHVGVTGDKDPGYGSTSKMIAESAICLVKDATETPGGIWTPAPAMGQKLIKRLVEKAGLTFEIEA